MDHVSIPAERACSLHSNCTEAEELYMETTGETVIPVEFHRHEIDWRARAEAATDALAQMAVKVMTLQEAITYRDMVISRITVLMKAKSI